MTENKKNQLLLIKNGRVIDPASGTDGYRDILIHDGRIVKMGFCGTLDDMAEEALIYIRAQAEMAENTGSGKSGECIMSPNNEDEDIAGQEEIEYSKERSTIQLATIDAGGMVVAPGLVDAHVHFRDPGFTDKEDILTGGEAAKKGGFTTVVMMGNTEPHMDNEETIRYALEKGAKTGIRVFTCANVTKGMSGEELTDMEGLLKSGILPESAKVQGCPGLFSDNAEHVNSAVALFTDDGKPLTDDKLMRKACEEAKRLEKVISLHEEDPSYITENGVNAGEAAGALGLTGSPRDAEIAMVKRDIEIANETGASITIQHISTAEAVDMIRQARKTNPGIHAEATPHHFTLTDAAVSAHGTMAKMNPPLRKEEDRIAIIEGLADGTIETIATDHAPHTAEEKAREFAKAPSGIIGLETSLGLGIRELVQKGHMNLMTLLARITCQPADIYGLNVVYMVPVSEGDVLGEEKDDSDKNSDAGIDEEKSWERKLIWEPMAMPLGRIYEGGPADLVIFSENEEWTVGSSFASKACNSPFVGEKLPGKIHYTICNGEVVYCRD